ncbi:S-adenosylmethionine synthetase N-terminal domain-containing protein [Globicatella sanguinis]|uniref:S-adenosylmethionine synthetase N-terminal domain-containing protein n=1 Tax=Globicatella sanguinis TaxID=13076 RepID=UPI0008248736|nr:S-adenosylmethionine synthetase N-terminal domain-containing protein [Globicatella sanguinis]
MFEKVNPSHPDKVADRIAGAIVDCAYKISDNPKIAVEVLIGHGVCHVVIESDVRITYEDIMAIVKRIGGDVYLDLLNVPQDEALNANQQDKVRCGDNGIFKGVKVSQEERNLSKFVRTTYERYPFDGKYIINGNTIIACQSNVEKLNVDDKYNLVFNPLGYWTGGTDVDTGATNRKLGSDMGRAVTGGGLHGKDLSKADVAVNIYAHLKAQETGRDVELCCAIGDETVDGKPYSEIVKVARNYIDSLGGFEKLAEWGLI